MPIKRLELPEIRHLVQNRTVGAAEGEERTPPTTVLVATLPVAEIIHNLIGDDKSKISWKGRVLISSTTPEFARRTSGNPRKAYVRIADIRHEIVSRELPNMQCVSCPLGSETC